VIGHALIDRPSLPGALNVGLTGASFSLRWNARSEARALAVN